MASSWKSCLPELAGHHLTRVLHLGALRLIETERVEDFYASTQRPECRFIARARIGAETTQTRVWTGLVLGTELNWN